MFKVVIWLVLSLISCCGWIVYGLQQQHEEQSVAFRILFRDISVKLAQNDVILSLLSATSTPSVVQQKFPQILRWEQRTQPILTDVLLPLEKLLPLENGTYWLNSQHIALLIDLRALLVDLPQISYFKHISINWQDRSLIELGTAGTNVYWTWDKALSSTSQPFELLVGNNPDWATLPWLMLLITSLFWAGVVYFFSKYRAHEHQRNIADLRAHFSELMRLNTTGEIAAGIVHELNQPLTAILSYNQTALRLLRQQQGQNVQPLLEAAVVQIKRISALLLGFRQKLNSETLDLQPVNLNQIWSGVIMLLEKELSCGKIKIINQMPETLPDIMAAPLCIEQIFHNVLTNAIQAQQHNATGWVVIDAYQPGRGVTLTITDGGSGLSEQALQEVFMPFFTTRPDGIGLGMALTETLIQRLGGNIKAENIAGQGARFTLWFPFDPKEE